MGIKYKHIKMGEDIFTLKTKEIENNLFSYSYHTRYLNKLHTKDFDKEDPHYISTYSSFIGEVYENIIYELLLRYAINEPSITKFVLKGPHQNGHRNEKNGLLIDRNDQIVYKSGYKDVSEFDGLFFTKGEVWFVESTIVKTTASLKKRLKKKKALLQLIFPKFTIRALIVLSDGVIGINSFPSYCTVWVTKQLEDVNLIDKLLDIKNQPKKEFIKINSKKFIETKDIKISTFKYFETLSSILKEVRGKQDLIVDFDFLSSSKIEQYFDIFSKLYIGFVNTNEFKQLYSSFNLENVDENKVIVTIEKTTKGFELFYYAKLLVSSKTKSKLKKIEILEDNTLKISDKDPKGFTASETKYMKYIWKSYHTLTKQNIIDINLNCKNKQHISKKRDIFILSDKQIEDVYNLPTFKINYLPSNIDISKYDALVFTSKNGVLSLNSFNKQWKSIPSYAISYKTAQTITQNGGTLEYTGKSAHGNNFAKELVPLLQDKNVLYIQPKTVVSKLVEILKDSGIKCDELITYETVCKRYTNDYKPSKNSIIILSSPSTLKCFLENFEWDDSYIAIAIGKTTMKFIPDYINVKVSKHTSLDACVKLARTLQ
jgi:uroporphyrinogen-III synthase